jgi:hypothetical protein
MQVTGRIIHIGETESFGAGGKFKKRTLVIETPGKYPQKLPIEFTMKKAPMLDAYSLGQEVEIDINLRGREWKGKYYPSIEGWKIQLTNEADSDQSPPAANYEETYSDEDIPF